MSTLTRPVLVALAALLGAAPALAAEGPGRPVARGLVVHRPSSRPLAAPLGVAVAPGVTFATPFTVVAGGAVVRVPHYIGPDGTYADDADLVRSIDGTPCGQACTRAALLRWGYAPAE